jgi:DNA-binding response OmpR family regulator
MQKYNILWADDEIDLLKAHIIFLEQKGYSITPVNNGVDALENIASKNFDVIFLDENMPGMNGLEVLSQIKEKHSNLPVVMITKSEEEYIMEEAIGSKIADYLIKPLKPQQIVLSLKKILDNKRLISEKTNTNYQKAFQQISMQYNDVLDHEEWTEVFLKLTRHELKIEETEEKSMKDILQMQKSEANKNFCDFVEENYYDWLQNNEQAPLLSHKVLDHVIAPKLLKSKKTLYWVVIDNLRLDQWEILEPIIQKYFTTDKKHNYYSILPTATQYARNAMFSGLMPLEMAKKHPNLWVGEDQEGGKNNNEKEFLKAYFSSKNNDVKIDYHKILTNEKGNELNKKFLNTHNFNLVAVVYNFVDMLSHARTDVKMIKELAADESAYRSLTKSWFEHSPLLELLKKIAESGSDVILTTDHGTKRVGSPYKIVGDKSVNTNLRYKQGKNLSLKEKGVFMMHDPEAYLLPKINVSSKYAFTKNDDFFIYPNNYNKFVSLYQDTFQHGGISMEEMILPLIELSPKNS